MHPPALHIDPKNVVEFSEPELGTGLYHTKPRTIHDLEFMETVRRFFGIGTLHRSEKLHVFYFIPTLVIEIGMERILSGAGIE